MSRSLSLSTAALLATATVCIASTTAASPREECVEAHSRAQDLRERGQLSRARQTFLACAQTSCPALVQQDCARYAEELGQLVPTVTFSARDANAADLPATSVYVDDVLAATRLDDGRTYELDPGKHVVRYVHDGRETSLKVVLNQGERGRLLVATFVDRTAPGRREAGETTEPPASEPKRSALPLVLAGLGVAAAVTGGVLFAVGSSSVPDACTTATRECAVPPNDPTLAKAESSVRLANTGIAVAVGGVVTMAVALVWYFAQPMGTPDARRGRAAGSLFTF